MWTQLQVGEVFSGNPRSRPTNSYFTGEKKKQQCLFKSESNQKITHMLHH